MKELKSTFKPWLGKLFLIFNPTQELIRLLESEFTQFEPKREAAKVWNDQFEACKKGAKKVWFLILYL